MLRLPMMLLLVLAVADATADTAPGPHSVFDARFRQLLEETGVPGGAYSIVRDDRIEQVAGHGVRTVGGSETVDASTVFRIASVSKTFAAHLTALLVHDGALRWDASLSQFLPRFRLKPAGAAARLQLQHLIGQSTGIIPNAYDNLLDDGIALTKILPQFRTLEPICAPGQCYTYQNILFALIDPVVEQVAQQSYSTLLGERLLRPLGMEHASVGLQALLASANHASPHVRRDGHWTSTEVQPGYYQLPPAAGINASATDLGRWLIAQLGHRPDVISPAAIETLTRKRVRTPRELRRRHWGELLSDAHYGLGWRIYRIGDEEIYMHSGWVEGYVADIAYSRHRGIGLAVLLNGESSVINEITTTFWSEMLRDADEPNADAGIHSPAVAPPSSIRMQR